MATRESGVTLLDMVIAVAIVVVVLGVAYPGLKVANDTMATSGSRDRMERAGDKLLKVLTEEIRAGLVTDSSTSPPSITLLRPRREVTLTEISEEGATPWSGDSRVLRFRQTDSLSEHEAKEDVNGDGDRNDYFALGVLELVEGGSTRPILSRSPILLGMPDFQGDVDGDGKPDPLFVIDKRSVHLSVHLAGRDAQGRWLRSNVRCTLHLRNTQEQ